MFEDLEEKMEHDWRLRWHYHKEKIKLDISEWWYGLWRSTTDVIEEERSIIVREINPVSSIQPVSETINLPEPEFEEVKELYSNKPLRFSLFRRHRN